jgi:predicted acyltransferase
MKENQISLNNNRLGSIDFMRSFIMFLMILVNDLATVKGLPFWAYHMPSNQNGITLVDMVFPAFLFIVGLSIPFAIKSRLNKGENQLKLIYHISIRTVSLLFLGVLIINGRAINADATGISYALWNTLMFISVILVWNVYSTKNGQMSYQAKTLKCVGIISLLVLMFIYKRGVGDEISWMRTEWWGILGLIGWAYLASSLCFIFLKGDWRFLLIVFVGLVTLAILEHANILLSGHILSPFISSILLPVTLAGVIVSQILFNKGQDKESDNQDKKLTMIVLFAIACFAGGWIFSGFGVFGGRVSWTLINCGIGISLFLISYYFVDRQKLFSSENLLKPFGTNTLLAFLIPDLVYALVTTGLFNNTMFSQGILGAIRSIFFTLFILLIVWLLTKAKVRLKL